eukprot:2062306-Amphidinium_carterae.1
MLAATAKIRFDYVGKVSSQGNYVLPSVWSAFRTASSLVPSGQDRLVKEYHFCNTIKMSSKTSYSYRCSVVKGKGHEGQ